MMRTCFAAVAAVLVIAGCATGSRTQLREVVDGGAGAATPISRIVIVAVASDRSVRAAWEEAFAGRLAARGIAIASGDALPGRAPPQQCAKHFRCKCVGQRLDAVGSIERS